MVRKIIHIDEEACNGCGACAKAPATRGHRHGKRQGPPAAGRLLRRSGDCLPACPVNAITFVEREAVPYDQAAVLASAGGRQGRPVCTLPGGCPGSAARSLSRPARTAAPAPALAGE